MLKKQNNGPFDIIGAGHRLQARLAKLQGKPTSAMRTDYAVDGRPVIFIHTPQTGGTSLGRAFGVKRRSHATAAERLSEKSWLSTYSVVAVRDPFRRFMSSYWSTIDPEKPTNGLVKKYGPAVKTLSPFEFLELLEQEPAFGGSQMRFVSFPSHTKPRADLILRFEDIRNWAATLVENRVVPEGFAIPHLNSKSKRPKSVEDILGVEGDELEELKRRIGVFFADDYKELGYPLPA